MRAWLAQGDGGQTLQFFYHDSFPPRNTVLHCNHENTKYKQKRTQLAIGLKLDPGVGQPVPDQAFRHLCQVPPVYKPV
jgi:hypothetical protein